ncbi:MAG: aldehyde dehydrogenase family protein [Micromonosporaceae bacterium]|nr:aldehyde dehydrogenase family protein [Micromonosporaceae bacterium]
MQHDDRYVGALYVGGEWIAPSSPQRIEVENPATEQVIGHVPAGQAADIDRAVAAAKAAFPHWSALSRAERADHLAALHEGLTKRRDEMAATITAEMGAPAGIAASIQVGLPLRVLDSYVQMLRQEEEPRRVGNSLVVTEPVGVVGAITPWNYPLNQTMAKLAAALAAGCTVVHKPSEIAPLSAFLLAQIAHDAGLPAGVYNVVSGDGPSAGEPLVRHEDVDMISFTGSTRAGRRVGALAADTVKRVALELGGKSANVILPDADLTAAVKVGVANCLLNAGQTCTAWTRMLVPADRQEEALQIALAAAAKYVPGDPTDPKTRLGPLVSAAQRDRVLEYIEIGVASGARLVLDGRPGLPPTGYYVGPTIFADVDPDSRIAQEEIFGPVLSVIPYRDEDEAVRIANGTPYGLAGAVWSSDVEHALAVARRLRTGQVDINGAPFNHLAPFGGYRRSGVGREFGEHGYLEFCQVKAIQLPPALLEQPGAAESGRAATSGEG